MTVKRPLRVLHLGNIANNALRNAKLQRARGIHADVLCFDYYYLMSCPEHLDGLEAAGLDEHFPDWWHSAPSALHCRPRWFAQGPMDVAVRYLLSNRLTRPLWWRWMQLERWLICRRSPRRKFCYYALAILTREWLRPPRSALRALLKIPARNEEWWEYALWDKLFDKYDIIQAYGILGAIPYKLGRKFIAYEHGTLRTLPFAPTAEGALCWLTYRSAQKVMITNLDCIDSAERLQIPRAKRVYLPHAFDDEEARAFATDNSGLQPPSTVVTFFAPARQHWLDGDPGWAKGNDRVLRAFARVNRLLPSRCRLICVDWGNDVGASKALIAELGLENSVKWLPVMSRRELWRQYLRSHAVIDQFIVGGIGGVGFEAMALGRRLISALDVPKALEFFGEAPPLLIAQSIDEIAGRMLDIIADPFDRDGKGALASEWMKRRHSGRRVVDLQLEAYQQMMERQR
jgi:glycosyltransferase involved in cell wall biosynthesis